MWAIIKAGKVWSGRFINRKKDGTEYHEDSSIAPIYANSGEMMKKAIDSSAELMNATMAFSRKPILNL